MRRVRGIASRVALLWIVWQAGALAAGPLVVAHQPAGDALSDQLCECPDAAPGRQCPMHHHSDTTAQASADHGLARCSMRAPVPPTDLGVNSIAFVAGMLPVQTAPLPTVEFAGLTTAASARAVTRAVPPASPPPEV